MLRELSALIVWHSRQQSKKTLPSCFIKLHPKVRCIQVIDCFEYCTSQKLHVDLTWQQLSGVNINITTLLKSLLHSLQMELFQMSHHAKEGGHLIFSL